MADLEKILNGLQHCIEKLDSVIGKTHGFDCISCSYFGECESIGHLLGLPLMRDALALLKAQQPRVLTLDEIKDGESYWLSAGKEFVTRPVICVHREDDAQIPYITFVWQFGTFSWESEEYGKTWWCWSARPTDEQRKAVKWDG